MKGQRITTNHVYDCDGHEPEGGFPDGKKTTGCWHCHTCDGFFTTEGVFGKGYIPHPKAHIDAIFKCPGCESILTWLPDVEITGVTT